MASLPDPRESRAVLIGISHYRRLTSLHAVQNNLRALTEELCDHGVWGLPSENCLVVQNPTTTADMLDPIAKASNDAFDTLLVYYAGHGLIDPRHGRLHLTLVESDPKRIYTAVAYEQVRDVLLDSQAARRVVVLDCCYSEDYLKVLS